jgi:hypothetical protein
MPETFRQWLDALDEILNREMGLSLEHLPNPPYRAYYNDHLTPEDAYYEIIENEYPGLEVSNIYYQEFDEFTDADPGL